jgi:hypothetical protein
MMIFEVLREGTKDDAVWLWGREGREVVLGVISREALEDNADPVQYSLSHVELVTLASANVETLSRVLNAKLDAGQVITPAPGDVPRVFVRSGDLRAAGEKLPASVLSSRPVSWASLQPAR